MKYKATFYYYADEANRSRGFVPLNSFSVVGGAHRIINLNSTTDFSISNELEQARQYKNLNVFMPPTKDGTDRNVAIHMTECANSKKKLKFGVWIDKLSGRKVVEHLLIKDENAIIKNLPRLVADNQMLIEISLPSAELDHGLYNAGEVLISVESM